MHVIMSRNVAQALPAGVRYLLHRGQRESSRAGDVVVAPGPVTTVYYQPTERVLHSAVRDANPFFHLAEIVWMLAGREDAAFLNNFVADFGSRFAESASGKPGWEAGGRVHGAYGHRWRKAFGFDQLDATVQRLREDRTTRQCVLQMWDATPYHSIEISGTDNVGDPAEGGPIRAGSDDLRGVWRDRPCNTHAYVRVRDGMLDLTVCCRSNDIVWGAYGANAVHFSALQEYLAARVGVEVGVYYQVSNNFHAYVKELDRLAHRARCPLGDLPTALLDDRYLRGEASPSPLVDSPGTFDLEALGLIQMYEDNEHQDVILDGNTFLRATVWPALMAHRAHKRRDREGALTWLGRMYATDWKIACSEWIDRRRG